MTAATTSMKSVQDHYDRMLGSVYSWIIGDFGVICRRNAALLESLGLQSGSGALAVDLGCGPGCHSIPLAEAGFRVIAVDFCDELLTELQGRAANLPITTVRDNILHFRNYLDEHPQAVLCMGDTLVHLPDWDAVRTLLEDVVDSLLPGGAFVASLRDYSTSPPHGQEQFIPVRSNADRIFTCFLQYREDAVEVRDILQTRDGDDWKLEVSQYRKLRLDYRRVIGLLQDLGMHVDAAFEDHGMICIRSVKPG
ncbi:MAG: class I SAM-dependent methyltransferase [Woeseiaceae bacterium]|nr:class I SAM-dependent methyltransferase [Woeseiaceae bacterium]